MNAPPSLTRRLMDEAYALARDLEDAVPRIESNTRSAVQLLQEQEAGSGHARTKQHYADVQAKNVQLAGRTLELIACTDELRRVVASDDYVRPAQDFLALVGRLQLDDEELGEAERTLVIIMRIPDAVDLRLASAHIPLFAASFYYSDILTAFLGLPSLKRRSLDVAWQLGGAILTDAAGTVVPFLGIMMAVHDVMEPQMKRVSERMTQATRAMDRLNQLEDELAALIGYQQFVDAMIRWAAEGLESARSAFATAEQTLAAVLAEAERR
jgi:hypothetical protein